MYPYINSINDVKKGKYPYPKGYTDTQPPSPAGGAQGGNPDLFTPHVSINVTVTNTGKRTGSHVVQLYVSMPTGVVDASTGDDITFPPWQLRGFEKIALEAGKSGSVAMNVSRKDLSYWSRGLGNWIMPEGEIKIGVGASSRDLPLQQVWSG